MDLQQYKKKKRELFWKVLPYLGSIIAQDDGEKLNAFLDTVIEESWEMSLKELENEMNHDQKQLTDGFAHPKDCVMCLSRTNIGE